MLNGISRLLLLGIVLSSTGPFHLLQADEAQATSVRPVSDNEQSQTASADETSEPIRFQFVLAELQGETKALQSAGFVTAPSGLMRYKARIDSSTSDSKFSELLRGLAGSMVVTVKSRPQVIALADQHAEIQFGSVSKGNEYLANIGENRYERRTVEEGRPAWNTCIRMLHSHCDHEGRRKIHLETTMTQPDGRAPVAGLNLEVGEPISTTQMVDTTIYQTIGEEMDAIAMITGPNRYFLVAFNSNFLPE